MYEFVTRDNEYRCLNDRTNSRGGVLDCVRCKGSRRLPSGIMRYAGKASPRRAEIGMECGIGETNFLPTMEQKAFSRMGSDIERDNSEIKVERIFNMGIGTRGGNL